MLYQRPGTKQIAWECSLWVNTHQFHCFWTEIMALPCGTDADRQKQGLTSASVRQSCLQQCCSVQPVQTT